MARIRVLEGDIAQQEVDAVVIASDTDLGAGSGVARAIHDAGGPSIRAECEPLAPVPLGGAVITGAGHLPARYVIHAASLEPGCATSEDSLREVTQRSLDLAAEHGIRSLAFPAVGTDPGGLSQQRCAEIMLEEVRTRADRDDLPEEVRFVLSGEPAYRVFEQVADAERIRALLERMER